MPNSLFAGFVHNLHCVVALVATSSRLPHGVVDHHLLSFDDFVAFVADGGINGGAGSEMASGRGLSSSE